MSQVFANVVPDFIALAIRKYMANSLEVFHMAHAFLLVGHRRLAIDVGLYALEIEISASPKLALWLLNMVLMEPVDTTNLDKV